MAVQVSIVNTSSTTFPGRNASGTGHVALGAQLLDAAGRVIHRDFARMDLHTDLAPGERRTLDLAFSAPSEPGDYQLKFDRVLEGVAWFESSGSTVEVRPFSVH